MPDDESLPADETSDEPVTDEKTDEKTDKKTDKAKRTEKVEKAEKADDEKPARKPVDRLLLVQAVVVLVAVGLFAWSLVAFVSAVRGPDYAADARVRDEVQVAANNAVEVLNSLDHRDIDGGLEAWAGVSTGDLQKQLTDLTDQQKAALSKVARISEGTVVSSAVTALDADAGTASVICFVEKRVGDTPTEVDQAAPSRIQFTVDLSEEDGTWLVSKLTPESVATPEGETAQ